MCKSSGGGRPLITNADTFLMCLIFGGSGGVDGLLAVYVSECRCVQREYFALEYGECDANGSE